MKVELKDNSEQFKREMQAKISNVLDSLGIGVMKWAQDELEHTDPRRVDTANLKNSIAFEVSESEKAVYVGTNVEYGIYVHEGTRKMTPNRFLKNAVVNHEEKIKNYIKQQLES